MFGGCSGGATLSPLLIPEPDIVPRRSCPVMLVKAGVRLSALARQGRDGTMMIPRRVNSVLVGWRSWASATVADPRWWAPQATSPVGLLLDRLGPQRGWKPVSSPTRGLEPYGLSAR